MMLSISPLLALISLLTVPLSLVVTILIAQPLAEAVRRAVGSDRHAQRPRRGDAHRPRHRQGVRAPGGGDRDRSTSENDAALRGQLSGPVHLGHHPAGDEHHRQPQLRGHRGHRRAAGGDRPDVPRRRPGASSSTRASSPMPIIQAASIVNVLQSAVASAERVFELLDEPEEAPDPVDAARPGRRAGDVVLDGRLVPVPARHAADRGPGPRRAAGRRRSPSWVRPAPARRRWSTC